MQYKYFIFAFVLAVALTMSASAHHSHGQYDLATWTPFEGVVKEIHYLNPHSWIYLEVKDAKSGAPVTWALEAASPREIEGNGVKQDHVKSGDRIKVRCHLLINGANGCLLGYVTPMHGDQARGAGVEREWD
jgi:uncharacterized protein DUF6152